MRIIIAFLLFISPGLYATDNSLTEVRLLFHKSVSDKASCIKLIAALSSYNESNNITLAAYKAGATMMLAKYGFNPFSKLSDFNEGRSLLEKCIAKEPSNTEARYLRLIIQSTAPGFLGYNKSIPEDKDFLIKHVSALNDWQLKEMIITYLKSSECLSAVEKKGLWP